jgi:hypothetical protein
VNIIVDAAVNISSKNKQRYEDARNKFRTSLRESYDAMNVMIEILHEDNPAWSINQIAKYIWNENKKVWGFSVRSIYNHLNKQNRELIEKKFNPTQKKGKGKKVASLQPQEEFNTEEHEPSNFDGVHHPPQAPQGKLYNDPEDYDPDYVGYIRDFLDFLTGYIKEYDSIITQDDIKGTQEYRLNILKSLSKKDLRKLERQWKVIALGLQNMYALIQVVKKENSSKEAT